MCWHVKIIKINSFKETFLLALYDMEEKVKYLTQQKVLFYTFKIDSFE
jgi:hypothetical protein